MFTLYTQRNHKFYMKYKRLSKQEVADMKVMVQQGVAPEDISRHFGIAISSVHNYKKQFKQQGLTFPDVRGKRPTNKGVQPSGVVTKPVESVKSQTNQSVGNTGYHQFIVNGMEVKIDQNAKSVNIGNGIIQIEF